MSRKNEDLIVVILDRSGSMAVGYDNHLAGINKFISEQKEVSKPARMTLVQFDDHYEVNYEEWDIGNIPLLSKDTYIPRGMTALLDAIGRTVDSVGMKLSRKQEHDRPDKVIVVIQTDGQENSSREYTTEKVAELITQQREKYGWHFVFLGAGIDAIATAATLNIPKGSTMSYNKSLIGTMSTYGATSGAVSNVRTGNAQAINFTDKNREDAAKEDK